jgi:adenylyltransferase/sulfurtransferase
MVQRDIERDDEQEYTPIELGERVARDDAPQLIDVREPNEHAYARIEGARLIPLRTLPLRSAELDRDAELVVYCHHGMRSAQAVAFLRSQGFSHARNLVGGIDRWSVDVDPAVPRY